MKLWTLGVRAILLVIGLIVLMPQPGNAIPAFARKYGVKCYTCHTVPPALNKNGYMFKRLGYRMPPDEMDGSKPAPKIDRLDKDIKFRYHALVALILQASFTDDKTVADAGNTTSASPSTSCGSEHGSEFLLFQLQPGRGGAVHCRGRAGDRLLLLRPLRALPGGTNDLEQGFGVYTARSGQQQLLHQGRRDAHAGGRGNAGGHVL
jgi:hypothetical protein